MRVARQVFFAGRVQGVGFRYTVRHIAMGFDVAGWVRNLVDGRVELLAVGEEAEVEAFVAAIGASALESHIRNVETAAVTPVPAVAGFEIRA